MSYERFVGMRYLTTRGRQTFISIITVISVGGVAVGVAALVIVLAVLTGFEETLKEKILGINSQVLVMRLGGIEDPERVIETVLATPGVEAATPFIYGHVMLATDYAQAGVVVRGIDPTTAPGVIEVLARLEEGSLDDLAPAEGDPLPGIVLGAGLARGLGVFVGDRVTGISSAGSLTPFMYVPQLRPFVVTGIFKSGMDEYDSQLCYVHLGEARRLLGMGPEVTGVELRASDPYRADAIAEGIRTRLGGFPFTVRSWIDMNKPLFAAFKLEKVVYFIVVVLITLVASFNIVSTLIMVVMEKTKDIAILKTMGATGRSIRRIFMIEGIVVGIGGTLTGLGLGLATALNLPRLAEWVERAFDIQILPDGVFYIDKVPSQVNPSEVAIIAITAIAICLFATVLPAWQASRLDPAEALRYE